MNTSEQSLTTLASEVVRVLDERCKAGCRPDHQSWEGFENGDGVEVGSEIERLIRRAKRLLNQSHPS